MIAGARWSISLLVVALAGTVSVCQSRNYSPTPTVPANAKKQFAVLPAIAASAPLGDVFYGQIATIISCHGLTIGSFWSSINWGDNSLSAGELVSGYQGVLNASHIFLVPQTYTIPISTTEKCVNIVGGGYGGTTSDAVAASLTLTVAAATPPTGLTLSSATVAGGAPVTATITIASTTVDTQLWLGLSQASFASVQPTVLIPAGQTTATVTISTQKPVPSPQNLTVFAISGGVSKSVVLTVH